MELRITETSAITDYEKQKLAKEADFLLVGRTDKSINVVSGGEKTSIKELASFNRTGTFNGVLKIPTDNYPYIIQFGVAEIGADSSKTIDFTEAYPNRCFQVQATLRAGDGADIVLSTNPSEDSFRLTADGGISTNNTVQWYAIGF